MHEVPNFSDWNAGDIVLVEAGHTLIGLGLQTAQNISTRPLMRGGSNWTHAGIYVGGGQIVDAIWGRGVVQQSVWNYCQNRSLRVRRLSNPRIPATNVANIAKVAMSYIPQQYAWWQVVLGKLGLANAPKQDQLYCSTLVGLAVTQATGLDLAFWPSCQPLYPAILATQPDLTDVPLEWRHY